MNIHDLKIIPVYFNQMSLGQKTWELRKADRDFKVGDQLNLMEYAINPTIRGLTGRVIHRWIVGVNKPDEHVKIAEGYVLLSLTDEPTLEALLDPRTTSYKTTEPYSKP